MLIANERTEAPRTNRLAREVSPYLLQHQHNPVDWYAWGAEAFAAARQFDRPIFLSIGYSTCHWCHVMERESFEDASVAAFLNAHFICIKVDREERPDLDRIYLSAVQAITGQGGWPLSVFLTPELRPFYGGTYFPPQAKYGKPSFLELLERVSQVWQTQRQEVGESAKEMCERLGASAGRGQPAAGRDAHAVSTQAAGLLKKEYDPAHGGFGAAPKFPQPCLPAYLLQFGVREGDPAAVEMALTTCRKMAAGGIYDQLGGGFSRYAVDAQWQVPHFEKMLYDNAQLLSLYLDAFQASGEEDFARVARGIIQYVLRDMTHPLGGFYSAEDADSEGREGRFYCWTQAELACLLPPEEYRVVVRHFGVTEAGNFVDHSDPDPLPGQNVLHVVANRLTRPEQAWLEAAKARMLAARSQRVRPHLDDKILASWNGLMMGALARAGLVLEDAQVLEAARKNAAFIRGHLWDAGRRTLYHRWRDGERDTVQLLSAYAFQLQGHLALYEATLAPEYLEFCLALAEAMLERFYDREHGGFWQSAGGDDLIVRMKESYDGAEPSGSSVATLGLLKLAAITDRPDFQAAAEHTIRASAGVLERLPQAMICMLGAHDFLAHPPVRVVIAGAPGHPATRALLSVAQEGYQPHRVVMGNHGLVGAHARALKPPSGPSAAFVCVRTFCLPPAGDPATLRERLGKYDPPIGLV